MTVTIHTGDCRDVLRKLPAQSVNTCISSPPYFGLRDYGVAGQIGMEDVPDCLGWATGARCGACFVCVLVNVYREVRRVLRDDGTCWVNLGDSYGKAKQLLGVPWRVALALQADGWFLRQDIIWAKPNPMPESVTDRCTKAHEYLFLLAKSPRYYYDADAIREPLLDSTVKRIAQNVARQAGSNRVPGKTNGPMKAVARGMRNSDPESFGLTRGTTNQCCASAGGANKRSVWTVATQPYKEAHFATFPPALIEPCVLAGCPVGGTVLDPFGGSGTTGEVAEHLGRDSILIELSPAYVALSERRTQQGGLKLMADERENQITAEAPGVG